MKNNEAIDLVELVERYGDDQKCRTYLEHLRWPHGIRCPKCGGDKISSILKRDQYNDALPLAEKAAQLAPKLYAARNVLGRVLLELGQVDRSIKELEEGVKLAPSSPEMHFALARAYTRAGRKDDAAREREIFKSLQDEFNKKRQAEEKPNPQ